MYVEFWIKRDIWNVLLVYYMYMCIRMSVGECDTKLSLQGIKYGTYVHVCLCVGVYVFVYWYMHEYIYACVYIYLRYAWAIMCVYDFL